MSSPGFRGPRKVNNTRSSPIVTRQRTRCNQNSGHRSHKDGDDNPHMSYDDPDRPQKAGGASKTGGITQRGNGEGKAGQGKHNDSNSKGSGRQWQPAALLFSEMLVGHCTEVTA